MDKPWMTMDRLSDEYEEGVKYFIECAGEHAGPDNLNFIRCPCLNCGNHLHQSLDDIKDHLFRVGFEKSYRTWIWHGEKPHSGKSRSVDTHEPPCQDFDMETPCDFGDTVRMVNDAYESFTGNPEKLCKLLEDAEKPLYKGCKSYTKLSSLVELFNLKASSGWSDTSFTKLLKVLGKMLPDNNEVPQSMTKARNVLSTFGMEVQKIHACPNDCILYRGDEYKDLTSCPTCGTSRYQEKKGKAPAKVLWYFPPLPRFAKMFQSAQTSKDLVWHADRRVEVDGQMRHPADSPAWKEVDKRWPEFAEDPRNLRLALSTDGINPHSNLSSRHSCWPVMLITYNLPPWLCMKRKFLMLTMLISGPRQPGNDIDVYLRPLIEDLQALWNPGVEVYDAYKQESFTLRAVLLWTINDFPALGNLAGCSVKGYLACPICGEKTDSTRLKHSNKNIYQSHRKFLPKNHRYRRQRKAFNGQQELRSHPDPLTGEVISEKLKGMKVRWGKPKLVIPKPKTSRKKSKASNEESQTREKQPSTSDENESGKYWKKRSIFFELEYWEFLLVRHNLDVMHIEKNICDSIIGTLLNIKYKTKDDLKSRLDLLEMDMRKELAPEKRGNRTYLPPACHTLSRAEKVTVCNTLRELKVPDGYSSHFRHRVSMQDLKVYGLKSHDCHILMQQLLPVAIRSVLPKHVRYTITRLCFFFNSLCTKVVDVSKLKEIQDNLVLTLCLLEMYFPPSFFDVMVHLSVHLIREVELCGPVFFRWMYPFERFMKILKGYVRNRNRPEGCIAENYILEEAVEFLSEYLSGVNAVGVPSVRNMDTNDTEKENTISKGKPLGGMNVVEVDEKTWEQAHQCVLANTNDVQPYIEKHMEHLKLTYPRKSAKWYQDEHTRTFIYWIRQRVKEEAAVTGNKLSNTLKVIAQGPRRDVLKCSGYVIGGYRFHTKDHEASLVNQNSGVGLMATTVQISSAKDKNPVVSEMGYYGVITEIWLLDYLVLKVPVFKCDWVDNRNGIKVDDLGFTSVDLGRIGHKEDPFVMASQAKQVFYVPDQLDPKWSIALRTPERDYLEEGNEDELDHTSSKVFPDVDFLSSGASVSSYARVDCEGTYVDPTSND